MNDPALIGKNCFCLSDCVIEKYSESEKVLPFEDDCTIGTYKEDNEGYFDDIGHLIANKV